MIEESNSSSVPGTPPAVPPISAPPPQFQPSPSPQFQPSPSLTRSPLLVSADHDIQPENTIKTPKNRTPKNLTPRFITPIGSPIRKALKLTALNEHDAWLPITQSRKGNAYYAAFHCLCSGVGIQALVLPVSFVFLGWTWGVILLTMGFIWQLYTLYLLVQLHESHETGVRYSRYLHLADATFGYKLSKWLVVVPLLYLSKGTCAALIILGGSTSQIFFYSACGEPCTVKSLTPAEWYLVFSCAAILLSQLPNLNSIAGASLVGAITAVGYCSIIWIVSVAKGTIPGVSYNPLREDKTVNNVFDLLNAIGIIAFAFRGHNLILEIQGSMPSSQKHPSRVPMWKGVKLAYTVVAMCLFPISIGGYWAYGQKIPKGGMLAAFRGFHGKDISQFVQGLTSLLVIISSLTSYQIYAMPIFDELEHRIVRRTKKPCPWWLRIMVRSLFGFTSFFLAVAIPFLGSVSGLLGGISLPVTLAYPCFMWLKLKKPKKFGPTWYLNWILGLFGMVLTVALIVAGIWVIMHAGIQAKFFKPKGTPH